MQHDKIKAAILEATRFVNKATLLLQTEKMFNPEHGCQRSPRESGAARRASLDLTRALADMRRP